MSFQSHKKDRLAKRLKDTDLTRDQPLEMTRSANRSGLLRSLCLNIMVKEGASGKTLIEECLLAVARDSPADFLRFAQKLLPKEVAQEIRRSSPIVIVNNGVAPMSSGLMVDRGSLLIDADQ